MAVVRSIRYIYTYFKIKRGLIIFLFPALPGGETEKQFSDDEAEKPAEVKKVDDGTAEFGAWKVYTSGTAVAT